MHGKGIFGLTSSSRRFEESSTSKFFSYIALVQATEKGLKNRLEMQDKN